MSLRDDAHALFTEWQAPDDDQERLRRLYLEHVDACTEAMSRDCHPDHVTASAIIFSADHRRVLLTMHHIVKLWLQTGGHCEPADTTLVGAALREAREESGIQDLSIDPVPVQLSRHDVPSCGPIRPSYHLDVQFLAVAEPDAVRVISEESDDLAWFVVDELPAETDHDVGTLIAAARTRLRETP